MVGLMNFEGKRGAFVHRVVRFLQKNSGKKKPAGSFENLRAQ
jgi:hypothetical protein